MTNEKTKTLYAKRKAQGICANCGNAPAVTKFCEECRQQRNKDSNAYRAETKLLVLSHYGPNGKLQCSWPDCTVIDPDMLSLDHVNNDGSKDRAGSCPGGVQFYVKLKGKGFPEGFQTLCHNHQWKKELMRRRK